MSLFGLTCGGGGGRSKAKFYFQPFGQFPSAAAESELKNWKRHSFFKEAIWKSLFSFLDLQVFIVDYKSWHLAINKIVWYTFIFFNGNSQNTHTKFHWAHLLQFCMNKKVEFYPPSKKYLKKLKFKILDYGTGTAATKWIALSIILSRAKVALILMILSSWFGSRLVPSDLL